MVQGTGLNSGIGASVGELADQVDRERRDLPVSEDVVGRGRRENRDSDQVVQRRVGGYRFVEPLERETPPLQVRLQSTAAADKDLLVEPVEVD